MAGGDRARRRCVAEALAYAGAALPPDVARLGADGGALCRSPTASTPIAVLAPQLPDLLAPGGVACLEIGAGQLMPPLFAAAGFTIESRRDLKGIERCLF
jgi:release factor glutamine methyltransferase